MNRTQAASTSRSLVKLDVRALLLPVVGLLLLGLGLWRLTAPPMEWDEGWTASVARNWVERGVYGRFLSGQPVPSGLEASFWVTGPVALSFRLFGIGIWQARIFGVITTIAALGLICYLARHLYNRAVAAGTLVVLLLLSIHPQLNPLLIGRQLLGEMPMLCYLLAGYTCLLLALRRSAWFIGGAIVWWAIALLTKLQVLPFWALSLLAPAALALVKRRQRTALLVGGGMLAALGCMELLQAGMNLIWQEYRPPASAEFGTVTGLYSVMAIVPGLFNRLYATKVVLLMGIPTLAGLLYGVRQFWHNLRRSSGPEEESGVALRLSFLVLSGSWFGWFTLLSVGVPRYLFPASFIGSIFVASLLYDLTAHFSVGTTLSRAIQALLHRRWTRQTTKACLALLLLMYALPLTLRTISHYYLHYEDRSAERVAQFLDTTTPPNALVETYESELHFLLHRPYHFPPDQTHVELNRRSLLHQSVHIMYDPLAANPDYLVVGTFASVNQLYTPVIQSGAFHLIHQDGPYSVYRRAR